MSQPEPSTRRWLCSTGMWAPAFARTFSRRSGPSTASEILPTLSAKLVPEYGQGFSERNLARMIGFAEVFPDHQLVAALSKQLGWSHFVEIIPLKDELKREFYAEMCRVERWSVRTLRDRI